MAALFDDNTSAVAVVRWEEYPLLPLATTGTFPQADAALYANHALKTS